MPCENTGGFELLPDGVNVIHDELIHAVFRPIPLIVILNEKLADSSLNLAKIASVPIDIE